MEHLQQIALDRAQGNTPQLLGREEEMLCVQGTVAVYNGLDEKSPRLPGPGMVYLTSHRLCWIDNASAGVGMNQSPAAYAIPLARVAIVEHKSAFFTQSAKIVVHLNREEDGKGDKDVVYPFRNNSNGQGSGSGASVLRFSFRDGGSSKMFAALQGSLRQREWTKKVLTEAEQRIETARQKHGGFSTSNAGVGGIMKRVDKDVEDSAQTISQAFQDLDALMGKAKDMVTLADKFSNKLAAKSKQGDEGNNNSEENEFQAHVVALGIANPVTRATHGSLYHREMAKELARVIAKPLEANGGMLTLTDVYCLYNRARGTELISPDDLLAACKTFDEINRASGGFSGSGEGMMRLRKFEESGVMVLQSYAHSDEGIVVKLKSYFANEEADIKETENGSDVQQRNFEYELYLTPADYANFQAISAVLAKEQLVTAEKAGYLCRDETAEGLRFYRNVFC
eukprot:Nk52_evm51s158 gene=Nk52_evmTU51s158